MIPIPTLTLERAYQLPEVIKPVHLGPTWRRGADDKFVLPDLTIGWQVIDWAGEYLLGPTGEPWKFTFEQARFILWWYAVNPDGDFVYREGILQRMKGWGDQERTR